MNILSPFDFTEQSLTLVFARLGIELLVAAGIVWLTALIIIKITKARKHECGFTNHALICVMYGIIAAFAVINTILLLMIRGNGLYYFDIDYISWSFYSGYPLIIPEMLIDLVLIVIYFVIQSKIRNSINY